MQIDEIASQAEFQHLLFGQQLLDQVELLVEFASERFWLHLDEARGNKDKPLQLVSQFIDESLGSSSSNSNSNSGGELLASPHRLESIFRFLESFLLRALVDAASTPSKLIDAVRYLQQQIGNSSGSADSANLLRPLLSRQLLRAAAAQEQQQQTPQQPPTTVTVVYWNCGLKCPPNSLSRHRELSVNNNSSSNCFSPTMSSSSSMSPLSPNYDLNAFPAAAAAAAAAASSSSAFNNTAANNLAVAESCICSKTCLVEDEAQQQALSNTPLLKAARHFSGRVFSADELVRFGEEESRSAYNKKKKERFQQQQLQQLQQQRQQELEEFAAARGDSPDPVRPNDDDEDDDDDGENDVPAIPPPLQQQQQQQQPASSSSSRHRPSIIAVVEAGTEHMVRAIQTQLGYQLMGEWSQCPRTGTKKSRSDIALFLRNDLVQFVVPGSIRDGVGEAEEMLSRRREPAAAVSEQEQQKLRKSHDGRWSGFDLRVGGGSGNQILRISAVHLHYNGTKSTQDYPLLRRFAAQAGVADLSVVLGDFNRDPRSLFPAAATTNFFAHRAGAIDNLLVLHNNSASTATATRTTLVDEPTPCMEKAQQARHHAMTVAFEF